MHAQLDLEAVNVHSLVEDVCGLIRPLVRDDVALINDVPQGLPSVSADRTKLTQIFFNLIGNASRFTLVGVGRLCCVWGGDACVWEGGRRAYCIMHMQRTRKFNTSRLPLLSLCGPAEGPHPRWSTHPGRSLGDVRRRFRHWRGSDHHRHHLRPIRAGACVTIKHAPMNVRAP